MQNTPTYEELMALYLKEKSKNEAINKALSEKDKIINQKEKIINRKENEVAELHRQIKVANLFIQELLKKIEDKDIKLKKQLEDRFGIKSDKAETVYANEAEMFSSKKIGEKRNQAEKLVLRMRISLIYLKSNKERKLLI